jgi:hypothetical protein
VVSVDDELDVVVAVVVVEVVAVGVVVVLQPAAVWTPTASSLESEQSATPSHTLLYLRHSSPEVQVNSLQRKVVVRVVLVRVLVVRVLVVAVLVPVTVVDVVVHPSNAACEYASTIWLRTDAASWHADLSNARIRNVDNTVLPFAFPSPASSASSPRV